MEEPQSLEETEIDQGVNEGILVGNRLTVAKVRALNP